MSPVPDPGLRLELSSNARGELSSRLRSLVSSSVADCEAPPFRRVHGTNPVTRNRGARSQHSGAGGREALSRLGLHRGSSGRAVRHAYMQQLAQALHPDQPEHSLYFTDRRPKIETRRNDRVVPARWCSQGTRAPGHQGIHWSSMESQFYGNTAPGAPLVTLRCMHPASVTAEPENDGARIVHVYYPPDEITVLEIREVSAARRRARTILGWVSLVSNGRVLWTEVKHRPPPSAVVLPPEPGQGLLDARSSGRTRIAMGHWRQEAAASRATATDQHPRQPSDSSSSRCCLPVTIQFMPAQVPRYPCLLTRTA
jgi:hypothetical protein